MNKLIFVGTSETDETILRANDICLLDMYITNLPLTADAGIIGLMIFCRQCDRFDSW